MELFCLGDSVTFGLGVRSTLRWTNLISAETDCKIINLGLSGDTTGGMLTRLNTQILNRSEFTGYSADYPRVMVMGGGNDIFYSGSNVGARANMGAIIQQLSARGIAPIVGIPMKIELSNFPEKWAPLIDKPVIAAELDAYADWLITFCKAFGIRDVIDFRPDFLNPDGSVNTELFADGLHPNAAGHRLMANKVIEALKLKSTFKI